MSNTSRVLLIVAVLAVFGGLTWWYVKTGENEGVSPLMTQNQPKPASGLKNQANASNSTDASIDADLNSADLGLKDLDTDNASVDRGLSDVPVEQLQ